MMYAQSQFPQDTLSQKTKRLNKEFYNLTRIFILVTFPHIQKV